MKEINLNNPTELNKLLESYNQSFDSLVSIKIGYNGKLYMLLKTRIPAKETEKSARVKADNYYSAIIMDVDWYEGKIIEHIFLNLGCRKANFRMIQPIKDKILLLCSRSFYDREEGPEMNAVIVDRQGNTVNEFCLGDGIRNCIVTKEGKIITSYFDEGIFGNNGWNDPMGSSGLVVWSNDGTVIWESDKDISDCYAINLDNQDNLWYYYFDSFYLVKTDFKNEAVYKPEISGSSGFLITSDSKRILFEGGYDHHGEFQMASFSGSELNDYETILFTCDGKSLSMKYLSFLKSDAVFIDTENRLFVKEVLVNLKIEM